MSLTQVTNRLNVSVPVKGKLFETVDELQALSMVRATSFRPRKGEVIWNPKAQMPGYIQQNKKERFRPRKGEVIWNILMEILLWR